MNNLIILILFVLVLTVIILLVHFMNETKEQFAINDIKAENIKNKGKVCFDTCPDRNSIYNEIIILKDSIDVLKLKMNNYDEEISTLLDKKKQDDVDIEEKYKTLNEAHSAAKQQTVASLSKPASEMSGLSSEETQQLLSNHLSTDVSSNSLNDFKKTAKPMSREQIEQHNKKLAKLHDANNNKASTSIDAVKTSNSYINKNKASCVCSEDLNEEYPSLENEIINQANNFGFIQHYHNSKYCSSTDDCAKQYAKEKLKELCTAHKCKVVNPDGQYPYNLKQLNKNTEDTRPKNYQFPQ